MKVSDSARGLRFLVLAAAGVIWALPLMPGIDVRAQQIPPAIKFDVRAAKGLAVAPVYEGWYEIAGTKYAMFAYSNRNLQEIVDVPIGPQNNISPGPADQGQPTRFFPGVHYMGFAIALPKTQPATEATWTLTANGQTVSVPTSLDVQYLLSPHLENGTAYPGNTPPVLKFDPTGASAQGPYGITVNRTATVGRPLTLDIWVTDDGLPPPPRRDSRNVVLGGVQGLEINWEVSRGAGAVKFSERRPAVAQGKASTTATFGEAGDYMLHVMAIDSRSPNKCCWTNGYVKVKVDAGAPRP